MPQFGEGDETKLIVFQHGNWKEIMTGRKLLAMNNDQLRFTKLPRRLLDTAGNKDGSFSAGFQFILLKSACLDK